MKTKILLSAILALISAAIFTSCEKIKGEGGIITESRSVDQFHSVGLSISATVYFTQSSEYSLHISGQDNVLDKIETKIEGDELVIKLKNHVVLGKHEPITVYVTGPDVTGLNISGSGDIFNQETWTADEISLKISGSGNIRLNNVISDKINANISGSGNIKADAGSANIEDLTISGSGTIDLRNLVSENAYTKTSGSGDTYLHADSLLEVTISGSGNIWYSGSPSINTHISGSGNIHKL
jgi:hypothetical protein